MAASKKELEIMFLHDKPSRLITKLKGDKKYASILAKEVDCTYSHCVRILQDMKKLGLVDFEKKGRIKLVGLTKTGEEIAHAMEGIYLSFEKS
jgi:predicted transcriptional regulator